MDDLNLDLHKKETCAQNQGFLDGDLVFTQDPIHSTIDPIHNTAAKYRGVRHGRAQKELPPDISIERNLIRTPICVSNNKAATASEFIYEYNEQIIDGERCRPRLTITSTKGTSLPLPQHAKVLDVLLALFSRNFNEDGEVWFSYTDIARILGIVGTNTSSIKEAIKRYHENSLNFQNCWLDDPGRYTSESFFIVEKTDLFDPEGKKKNPRRSKKKENLHYVRFNQAVVKSVEKNFVRLFPKEAFHELEASTYTLYKLFYAPTDLAPVRRTLNFIARFLGWSERHDRLRLWITKCLSILQEKEFIQWWKYKEDDDCYEVCSFNLKDKRTISGLKNVSPLAAAKTKSSMAESSKKKSRFLNKNSRLPAKNVVKSAKPSAIKTSLEIKNVNYATKLLAQIADMPPGEEKDKFLANFAYDLKTLM
jgi:hypothetical protein